MQIKPFFEKYEEISRKPILKDDKGNQYSLVHFKGTVIEKPFKHPSGKHMMDGINSQNYFLGDCKTITKHYEGYAVLSDQLQKWQDGATSYDDTLYWSKPKKLERIEIDGFILQEAFIGTNSFFDGVTMNTTFYVWENSLRKKRCDK